MGVFDSMVKNCCQSTNQFNKLVLGLFNSRNDSGRLDIRGHQLCEAGHCHCAIVSHICLGLFDGFNSDAFCCEQGELGWV